MCGDWCWMLPCLAPVLPHVRERSFTDKRLRCTNIFVVVSELAIVHTPAASNQATLASRI